MAPRAAKEQARIEVRAMSSKSKLVEFILSLQNDAVLKRYEADSDAVIDAAGLSDEEKHAFKARDEHKVRDLLGAEHRSTRLVWPYKRPPHPHK